MKPPDRRERAIARTREDILQAAGKAFVRRGFGAATMQDIASEAGYTAASLYTYFRSKQEIVEAMAAHLTEEYTRIYDEPMPANLSFREKYDLLIMRQFELIDRQRGLFMSFTSAEHGADMCPGSRHAGLFHRNFEHRIGCLTRWLRDNGKPEDIGGHDPDLVARFTIGMGFALLHRWMADERKHEDLKECAAIVREFFFYGVSGKPKSGAKKR